MVSSAGLQNYPKFVEKRRDSAVIKCLPAHIGFSHAWPEEPLEPSNKASQHKHWVDMCQGELYSTYGTENAKEWTCQNQRV
jgi:hypothetical protein